jgi:lipoic acid synthetase
VGSLERQRLPEWLRKPQTRFLAVHALKQNLRAHGLHTVCESARCPNLHECFGRGTATFLILGNRCTRDCGFCSVPAGPAATHELDPGEPVRVAQMAAAMRLNYVVITSVTRDDLPDGGSRHFSETIHEIRRALPAARIEVLTPDFRGDCGAVARVLDAAPDVFGHNIETVERLYRTVRPQAGYRRSLGVLEFARGHRAGVLIKSGLMAGLGETPEEVQQVLRHLRAAGTDIATIGQYLPPARRSLPVAEYVPPEQFDAWRDYGLSLGFKAVFSGPLVRSSYMADAVSEQVRCA